MKIFILTTVAILIQVAQCRPNSHSDKPKGIALGHNVPLYHEITNRMLPRQQSSPVTVVADKKLSHKDIQGETFESNVHPPKQSDDPVSEHLMVVKPSPSSSKKRIGKKPKSLKATLRRKNKQRKTDKNTGATKKPKHPKKKSRLPNKYNANKHGVKKTAKNQKHKKDKLKKEKLKKEKRAKREHLKSQ